MRNSLSKSHPEIASEWDPQLNENLTPNDITAGFRKPVWWRCSNDHSYQVSVCSRVRSKGCKICNQSIHIEKMRKAKLAKGRSFAEARPDLLHQWDYQANELAPSEISEKSHMEVWWVCGKKHEWKSTPQSRSRGYGCPTCSRENASDRTRLAKFRKAGISLAEKHPDLIAQWDYERNTHNPRQLAPKSGVRAHWICRYGHKWEATITNRSHNKSGCPFCTNQTSRLEVFLLCELRYLFSKAEWRKKIGGVECDIFLPEISVGIEVDGEYWHRKKHAADTSKTVFLMSKGFSLIRVRDSRLVSIEGVIVPFIHSAPELDACLNLVSKINESHPNERLHQYMTAGVQQNEHDYREIMSRLPAPPKEKSLLELFPDLAMEWDFSVNAPLTPELFLPGSEQKLAWVCSKGHQWTATIKNRTKRKSGCPICYREESSNKGLKRLSSKLGSLLIAKPRFLELWDYFKNQDITPSDLSVKSGRKVWWRCVNNHDYLRSPVQMDSNHDCPICSSLANRHPNLVEEWAFDLNGSLNPNNFKCKSTKKVWWRCSNQHTWSTSISTRTAGSNCPTCSKRIGGEKTRLTALKRSGSLNEKYPLIASNWHPTRNADSHPSDISPFSGKLFWWRCTKGHEFKRSPNDLVTLLRRGSKSWCPFCYKDVGHTETIEKIRKIKLSKSGSLADKFPALALQWHSTLNAELKPFDISPSSHKEVWWSCPEGHRWLKSVNYRTTLVKRGSKFGCPFCSKKGN